MNKEKDNKSIMDFSQYEGKIKKSKYRMNEIKNWIYNHKNKLTTYSAGALMLTVGIGVWLGPGHGWNYVTSPFRTKITTLETQKTLAEKTAKDALTEKGIAIKEKEKLRKENEEIKKFQISGENEKYIIDASEVYDSQREYKVNKNLEGGLTVKTKAISIGRTFDDVKTNMAWCASRLKFEKEALQKYLGAEWTDELHDKYTNNLIDIVILTQKNDWGEKVYYGSWNGGRFTSQGEIWLNKKAKKGIEDYLK